MPWQLARCLWAGPETGAFNVVFGDSAGDRLLFTDFGKNYNIDGNDTNPCNGSDDFGTVLVLITPAPSGQLIGGGQPNVYCENSTFFYDPGLRPDGQLIAAEAESNLAGASGQIVTTPIGGAVTSASTESPVTTGTKRLTIKG